MGCHEEAAYTKVTHLLVEKALEVVDKATPIFRADLPEQAEYVVSTQLIAELQLYANYEAERLLGRFKKGDAGE